MNVNLKNLLIIDIETVTQRSSLSELGPGLQKLWKHKAQFLRNEESMTEEEMYFARGGIYSEFGKVVVIGLGIFCTMPDQSLGLRITSMQSDDEKSLLLDFTDFITSKFNQDDLVLCAHNGKEFDFPYLCRRMLINGIEIPPSLNLTAKKPWEVQHLDTMELWKFGDRKNFTSLELLTEIFGIPSSKSDITGAQVNEVYYQGENGLQRIAEYCQGDIVATAQLCLKLHNLPAIDQDNIMTIARPSHGKKT